MVVFTLACYVLGVGVAFAITRRGTPDWWRHFIRAQLLVAGSTLSVVAGWRFRAGTQLLEAIGIALACYVVTALAVVWRHEGHERRSLGDCVLGAWSANANTAYWMTPMTTLLVGPAGTVISVLSDQLLMPLSVWWVSRLRRDAPIPQRARTSVFDYAGPVGFAAGLCLRAVHAPPTWTNDLLLIFGTFMAFIGAAMWAGSVRSVLARLDAPTPAGWRRYLVLSGARFAWFVVVAVVFWGTPAAPIALLGAFTVPTFFPANASVLYGYHSHVVGIASRWGWVLFPVGVTAAWLAR